MCLCVGEEVPRAVQIQPDGMAVLRQTGLELTVTELENCQEHYQGRMFGIDAQWMLDRLHFVSAGAVSFARASTIRRRLLPCSWQPPSFR